jgi:hypothetical protein
MTRRGAHCAPAGLKGGFEENRRTLCAPTKVNAISVGNWEEARKMFFGMWLVWILGGLGVLFFGGLLGIGNWAYFFLATGLLAGASAAVNRILEQLRDLDKRLQQIQAQLDRLTQAPSSEESDEPG